MRMAPIGGAGRCGGDALARLTRALAASTAAAGCDTLHVVAGTSRPWASATFVGERHRLTLTLAPIDAARRWLAALADAELPMRGHVAMPPATDAVAERDGTLAIDLSVLTLHDQ